jgi:hypothetical protein
VLAGCVHEVGGVARGVHLQRAPVQHVEAAKVAALRVVKVRRVLAEPFIG